MNSHTNTKFRPSKRLINVYFLFNLYLDYSIFLRLFQEHLKALNLNQCRELLVKVGIRHPSLILDILDEAEPPNPPEAPPAPSWCTCSRCRPMPTAEENICCGKTPYRCTSQLPVCFNVNISC